MEQKQTSITIDLEAAKILRVRKAELDLKDKSEVIKYLDKHQEK